MHQPRKRFGQNFLIDPVVIDCILAAINPQKTDNVIEIGPGQGALTEQLLPKLNKLQVIEIDRDLVPVIEENFAHLGDLIVHQADALDVDFSRFGQNLRIVGNLPYNISTPLMFHLLQYSSCVKDMHFMLQKEVAHRLAAVPGASAYGRLSVMMQYRCRVEVLFDVGSRAFRPAPKVESAFVRLRPHEVLPHSVKDESVLAEVVRQAFTQRRKTIRNALKTLITAEQLEQVDINPMLRPENLTVEQFVRIARLLEEDV